MHVSERKLNAGRQAGRKEGREVLAANIPSPKSNPKITATSVIAPSMNTPHQPE